MKTKDSKLSSPTWGKMASPLLCFHTVTVATPLDWMLTRQWGAKENLLENSSARGSLQGLANQVSQNHPALIHADSALVPPYLIPKLRITPS